MVVKDFLIKHVEGAKKLVKLKIDEERKIIKDIPLDIEIPNLEYFTKNKLGVVALEDDVVIGFIGVFNPWKGGFDTFDSLSTYSPYYGNAARVENRDRIYQDMIEYAFKKWNDEGILVGGLSLSAHDSIAKNALFEYGFGIRYKDRITKMKYKEINSKYKFYELPLCDFNKVRDLRIKLDLHLKESPSFCQSTHDECMEWIKEVEEGDRRTFVLEDNNDIIGYLDITEESDNFISEYKYMANISGAYLKEEYRGLNIFDDLLQLVTNQLLEEGYIYLGVDHESYNPNANRYWNKHFTEYANGVVRRIEDWSKGK